MYCLFSIASLSLPRCRRCDSVVYVCLLASAHLLSSELSTGCCLHYLYSCVASLGNPRESTDSKGNIVGI